MIRVNGNDIGHSVAQNSCGCCSEISGALVDYKRFDYNGENYEVPPGKMLADSILKAVFTQYNQEYPCMYYKLPDNLRQFLNGKEVRKCSCGSNCC